MTYPDPSVMRWWGWGVDGHDPQLSPGVEAMLEATLGAPAGALNPPVDEADVALPDRPLPPHVTAALAGAVGDEHVRADRTTRLRRAAGKSYPDLVRLRAGDAAGAPDAVVLPATSEEVAAVLAVCAEHGVAVVPFGGGTSVVGGVEALRGAHDHVIALDTRRLTRLVEADRTSRTATLEAGLTGPQAEAALAAYGLTLGHFPQSFEFSTVGGWVATRSAGQASTGVGRIDQLVLGLRAATPAGEVVARTVPASAAGPDVRQLLVGSEGTMGVITEATLKVRPAPEARAYEAFSVRSFAHGAEVLRALRQHDAAPDVLRLSDEAETQLSLAMAGTGRTQAAFGRYLKLRGHEGGCVIVAGWEGSAAAVRRRRLAARSVFVRHRALQLGTPAGKAWHSGRFHGPYLRDVLLDRRILVDTLETATTWSNLERLKGAVTDAIAETLARRGTPAFVGCHVSHVYTAGASLYFTYAARQEVGAELEQWRAVKAAASDAIVAGGGTITHHHGVGSDHAPWLAQEAGGPALDALRAAKAAFDPAGIMNPGKLLGPTPARIWNADVLDGAPTL